MGILTVTVESVRGITARKDPYCIVVVGGKQHKTPVAKGDVFNSKAEFASEGADSIEVRVYDDDVLFDDFLGAAKFHVKDGKQEAPIKAKDGKEIGTLVVSVSGGHGSSGHGSSGHGDSGHGHSEGKKKKERRDSGSSSSDSD